MTRLPRILAFDYFRNTFLPRLRLLAEVTLAGASLVLIAGIVIGMIR